MSSANIVGLAILENPRSESESPSNGRGIIFDAQFYLGPGEVALGCLRYFNNTDLSFDEGGIYFICTTVAKAVAGAETHPTTSSLNMNDYQFVGDIQWLIPANVEDQRHQPYVFISGTAKNVNQADATFEIDASQYTTALKNIASAKPQELKHEKHQSIFPLRVVIPDIKRYKTKPLPKPNSNVLVTGFLTRVDLSTEGTVNHFFVTMENITFLGRSMLPAPSTPEPVTTPNSSLKRKLKLSFESPSPSPTKRAKLDNIENLSTPPHK